MVPDDPEVVQEEPVAVTDEKKKGRKSRKGLFSLPSATHLSRVAKLVFNLDDNEATGNDTSAGGLHSYDLSRKEITTVPPSVWEMKHLHVLNLYMNKLESIPPEIGTLT